MAKKNPYVMTIGFNKDDPDHIYVADFLNTMERGKAQYIVKAIMAYQNPSGESVGHVMGSTVDYEKIREFVLKVLEERRSMSTIFKVDKALMQEQTQAQDAHSEKVELLDLDEAAVKDILTSLSMFQ